MDAELHCNILKCRKPLSDKAVVTTCSHIFCVDCASEKFRNSQLCPACETSLTENDDVVMCSLQPTNDYKTSVLSGLSPSLILEICSRAMSFWTYQVHQESSFQAAMLKNTQERNATLSKQLENVLREANSELTLLNNKVSQLERELDLERRKTREMAENMREKDKEYQKLKNQYDSIKRKALLAPNSLATTNKGPMNMGTDAIDIIDAPIQRVRGLANNGAVGNGTNMSDIAHGMDMNRVQRTPLRPGAGGGFSGMQNQSNATWQQGQQRRPGSGDQFGGRRSRGSGGGSDSEDIIEEIVGMPNQSGYRVSTRSAPAGSSGPTYFGQPAQSRNRAPTGAVPTPNRNRIIAPQPVRRAVGQFRPAPFVTR